MEKITEQELNDWINSRPISVLFFKSKDCGVCRVQLSRVQAIAENHGLPLKVIDLSENLHLSAPQMVLNVPVTKVFLKEKKYLKKELIWISNGLISS